MPAGLLLPYRKRKPLEPEVKHNLVWGWFRLLLGMTQMMGASAAILSFFAVGLNWHTWVLLGIGLTASIISRCLYRGR